MADLNPKEESDKKLLDSILHSLLNILKPLKVLANTVADLNESSDKLSQKKDILPIYTRTPENEIILVCLRTISILLSKSKYQRSGDNCNFIIQTLLSHLCQFNLIDVCLNLMKFIYFDYWKRVSTNSALDAEDSAASQAASSSNNLGGLMKLSYESRYYDELAPYFVRDPLNKDSFVIPPLNLALNTNAAATTSTEPNPATKTATVTAATSAPSATTTNVQTWVMQTDLHIAYTIR